MRAIGFAYFFGSALRDDFAATCSPFRSEVDKVVLSFLGINIAGRGRDSISFMRRYRSPYGTVTLTAERLRHILAFHPEVRNCLRYFADVLARPERTVSSKHDPAVFIHYRYLPNRKRYLAVVVHAERRFVVTAYLANKPKRDTL